MLIELIYNFYEEKNLKKPILPRKNQLFFRKDNSEICYTLKSHIAYMLENNLEELDLWLAERENYLLHFFCKYYQEIGDELDGKCGKICEGYKPKNGGNNVCKHYRHAYAPSDKHFTLKLKIKFNK